MDSVDSIEFNSEKLKYVNKTTFVATILQWNITVKYYSEILQWNITVIPAEYDSMTSDLLV